MLVVTLLAIAIRIRLLNSFQVEYDEAIHLIWLRLLSAGYKPYTEVYITYPPLYPLSIEAVWNLWPTEMVQRWFSVAYTVFGAIGTALLARKIAGPLAGVAAAALILFSSVLIKPSGTVMAEFPAVAWSTWTIWFALLYQEATTIRQKRLFLIISGLCLSASLLTKLLSPFVAILILLMIVTNHKARAFSHPARFKPLLTEVVLWGLALVLPAIILMFLIFDTGPLLQQVISQRLMARTAYAADLSALPARHEYLFSFVGKDAPLVILAAVGLFIAWKYHRQHFGIMLLWLLLALSFLAVHTPLRNKHFLVLIPVLAILGGITISKWASMLAHRRISVTGAGGLVLLFGVGWWQISVTLAYWDSKASVVPQPSADEVQMLAFIDEVTGPDDCLITDNMPLLYWSGRMTPPELAEMSGNRLISGALTSEELITISEQYDCQVVAPVSNRITKHLPDYMEWVKANYLGRVHYGIDPLFFAKANTNPQPVVPVWVDFDGKIAFQGYTLPSKPAAPGGRVPLGLIWAAQTTLDTDYAIFVQLRDANGVTLTNADYQPYKALVPTSKWPVGAAIQSMTWLSLPANILPNDYNIYIGLYRSDNFERLSLRGDTSGENALIIGPLRVQ